MVEHAKAAGKTRVFLTGATGVMGMAGLKELTRHRELYEISVLARPSRTNRKKLKPFEKNGVRVVWGDLMDESSLRSGIREADIVLHVGGMVSPMADLYPEKTLRVNVGSMEAIGRIVKEIETQEPSREIRVVYIGSVSQYGSKMPPDHWGKATDPQRPAQKDSYALSKVMAEKALKEAGLKKWVSIRQTSILHGGLLKNAGNPVVFHTPLDGVLEWISTEDSGRLLERVCRPGLPDDFWRKCYNAGGGQAYRKVNLEFERAILKALGCPAPEKVFEPNWFATRNFHGMWFEDSDDLDSILHYRQGDTFEDALKRIQSSLPFYYRLAPLVPAALIKFFMRRVAYHKDLGTLAWIRDNKEERIRLSWGSREAYERIGGWSEHKEIKLSTRGPGEEKID